MTEVISVLNWVAAIASTLAKDLQTLQDALSGQAGQPPTSSATVAPNQSSDGGVSRVSRETILKNIGGNV